MRKAEQEHPQTITPPTILVIWSANGSALIWAMSRRATYGSIQDQLIMLRSCCELLQHHLNITATTKQHRPNTRQHRIKLTKSSAQLTYTLRPPRSHKSFRVQSSVWKKPTRSVRNCDTAQVPWQTSCNRERHRHTTRQAQTHKMHIVPGYIQTDLLSTSSRPAVISHCAALDWPI